MNGLRSALDSARPFLFTLARVIIGVVFFWHGLSKFRGGLGGVEDFFAASGVPAPAVSVLFVAVVELVGGLGLIFGLGTRIWALLLSVIMIGALIFVKAEAGITGGANVDLALLAGLLMLAGYGAGPHSADAMLSLEGRPETEGSPTRVSA